MGSHQALTVCALHIYVVCVCCSHPSQCLKHANASGDLGAFVRRPQKRQQLISCQRTKANRLQEVQELTALAIA